MEKSIISEGKTTSEAIENGLNQLKVSKKDVDIKVLEEDTKKSFFSILTPRVVKVQLTLKENVEEYNEKKEIRKEIIDNISDDDFNIIKNNLEKFLDIFFKEVNLGKIDYEIINEKNDVKVDVNGDNVNILIGYRGDTLNALQVLVNRIGNKGLNETHRIIIDIASYREKRIKVLEDLAVKISKTVEKNKKSVTLEPMTPFERKIIHNKLQKSSRVTTHSIGKEPNRKIVIELKK